MSRKNSKLALWPGSAAGRAGAQSTYARSRLDSPGALTGAECGAPARAGMTGDNLGLTP